MINLKAFDEIKNKYNIHETPFLNRLSETVRKNKPYDGLRVLQNMPITVSSVLKIEPLLLGGADVTMTSLSFLPPKEDALQLIQSANIKFEPLHNFKQQYDLHLDCCAELIKICPPILGAVELTQTGSEIYKNSTLDYPIISIDDAGIKKIETFFGTGNGFFRALFHLFGQKIYDKDYMVFGFGKVAKGMIHALENYANHIYVVVDSLPVNQQYEKKISFISSEEIYLIKSLLKKMYCVVTATGINQLLSKEYKFSKTDFGNALLVNMGAEDEYGENFSESEVLYSKKPINFLLPEPTKIKYLDPVFYAHNLGIDLILFNSLEKGYHCFPEKLSDSIFQEWLDIYKENFF